MTDKKFDKLMKDAAVVLHKMPEAYKFSHRTVYDPTAMTTSWFMTASEIEELAGTLEGRNLVERFIIDCEHTINALMGALKEMASDYDSLEQQYNKYKEMQPSEKAKELFDHVNGIGVQLIDILVDHDKSHLKVEKLKDAVNTKDNRTKSSRAEYE